MVDKYSIPQQLGAAGQRYFDVRRGTKLVHKVFQGHAPKDIPVEQPTKYELVINLKTAKAIGLTIPETFLLRANVLLE